MKKLTFAFAAAALVSLGAVGTVAQAQPHVNAQVYLGVPTPQPVYVAPPRVYVQPAPVYYGPPQQQRRFYDHDRAHRWDERHSYYRRGDRDRDGDGVPNRYDRAPNNPYRR